MKTSCKLLLASGLILALAMVDAARGAPQAADQAVRPHLRSPAAAGHERAAAPAAHVADVTGTVQTRPPPGSVAPLSAAATHARAARARFDEARAAMERALLLREAPATTSVTALETAIGDLSYHLGFVERAVRSQDSIGKAKALVQDWYAAGLKIIKPPAEGVVELPMPTSLRSKAEAAAAMLDHVAAEASAAAPARSFNPAKKRASAPAPAVANDTAATAAVVW